MTARLAALLCLALALSAPARAQQERGRPAGLYYLGGSMVGSGLIGERLPGIGGSSVVIGNGPFLY